MEGINPVKKEGDKPTGETEPDTEAITDSGPTIDDSIVKPTINDTKIEAKQAEEKPKVVSAEPPKESTEPNQENTLITKSRVKTIILIVMAVVIISLLVFIFTQAKDQLTFERIPFLKESINSYDQTTDQEYEGPIFVENETGCHGYSCFLERFKLCEKVAMNLNVREGFTIYYEIIGPESNLCKVLTRYDQYPDEKYVGKEMTCLYDNSLDFDTAKQDDSKCEGELFELFNKKGGGISGGGGAGTEEGTSSGSEGPGYDSGVSLEIDIGKDNYYVGEPVGPINYRLTSEGEQFEGVLVVKYSRMSYSNYFTHLYGMEIENGQTTIPESTRAFNINETGYYAPLSAFNEAGVYSYSLTLYDCERILNFFNSTDCRATAEYEGLQNVSFMVKLSKSITVTDPENE